MIANPAITIGTKVSYWSEYYATDIIGRVISRTALQVKIESTSPIDGETIRRTVPVVYVEAV